MNLVSQLHGKENYINESIFYKLVMKANNSVVSTEVLNNVCDALELKTWKVKQRIGKDLLLKYTFEISGGRFNQPPLQV